MNNEQEFKIERGDEQWLTAFKESAAARAERPAWFWSAQRAKIRERISPEKKLPMWLVWASPAAICAVAALLLFGVHFPVVQHQQVPVTVATANAIQNVSDQQLMSELDETIGNSVPEALAPADLLAQEVNRGLQNQK